MKVRSQRTHYMGSSNRDISGFNTSNYKTQNVFERSFNKSKSLYSHNLQATMAAPVEDSNTRTNPFNGSHNQFETQRFDKKNIRPYKYPKMIFPTGRLELSCAPLLNNEVKSVQAEFKDKKINMHKLQELKRAFVKNNRDRRNLQAYFENYAQNGNIDSSGLTKIVKEYGFDINKDEYNLIVRLTHRANQSTSTSKVLNMTDFIQLMTKDDVFYKTLQVNQSQPNAQYTFSSNFSAKVHEVLRNKYPKLKQAFKIYRQRNEEITKKQFDYVMKKLDLTDLVLTGEERDKIYNDYSNENGVFNVEGLVCAIAEQQNKTKSQNKPTNQFQADLAANQEIEFTNSKKNRLFNMKTLSSLEYETQFVKARTVIEQLNKLRSKRKQAKQNDDIFKSEIKSDVASRQQVLNVTQKLLQKEGINFHKDDYEAFSAYLNYDVNGNISLTKINHQLFVQNEKQARDRIERRVRGEAPKKQSFNINGTDYDNAAAISCIAKLKSHKMNPETRQLFNLMDKDKDGYISESEFKQKINELKIMDNWEVQNLASFLKINEQGSINFRDFATKINEDIKQLNNQLPLVRDRNAKSCYNWSETTKIKNSMIKTLNQINDNQKATKFSAWPANLTMQDLSLVQPPSHSGMYASNAERFNDRKQDYGMRQKMAKVAIAEGKRQKIAHWNDILQQRAEINLQKEQQRAAARNYALRLTKEKYELNCHQ